MYIGKKRERVKEMLKKLDHVIMVVNNLEDAIKRYEKLLHLTPEGGSIKDVPDLKIAMLLIKDGSRIELIEPKENFKSKHGNS
jgi:hypothetical protein